MSTLQDLEVKKPPMTMKRRIRRVLVAIGGGAVLLLGFVMMITPGPGWVFVFAGLGILATEFAWAKRLLVFAKGKYSIWRVWLSRQSWVVKAVFWLSTAVFVVALMWFFNVLGWFGPMVGIDWTWLSSPLPFF